MTFVQNDPGKPSGRCWIEMNAHISNADMGGLFPDERQGLSSIEQQKKD